MSNNFLQVAKLREDARLPMRATDGAAGYDLFTLDHVVLHPHERHLFSTGIAMELPQGVGGFIWPRSGLASKHGIDRLAGLIDSDYRGEIKVLLVNHSDEIVYIHGGNRIAQIVFQPYHVFDNVIEVNWISRSDRGSGGFGSTGK